MTRDWRSHCMKSNCPPDRSGSACAAIASGVSKQGPNGQIQTMMVAQTPGCRDESLRAAASLAGSIAGKMPRYRNAKRSAGIQCP